VPQQLSVSGTAASEATASSTRGAETCRRARFRRQWTLGRSILFALLFAAAARLAWTLVRDSSLDPTGGALESGECHILSVAEDGTLIVRQPPGFERRDALGATPQSSVVRRVRLLGARSFADSAPPSPRNSATREFNQHSVTWLRATAEGRAARLEFDRRRFDDQGCWLAYVYLGEQLINVEVLRMGWVRYEHHPGDSPAKQRAMRQAENEARRAERGIWSLRGRADRELVPVSPPG